MIQLIILDYSDCSVHIYNISEDIEVSESLIQNLGFKTSECEWMFGTLKITFNNELK